METQFNAYLQMGFHHIADPKAYDHIVFIIALCAVYKVEEWRRMLILVTAFTLGHSLTLALASLKIVTPNYDIVEKLIPITIMLTAGWNVVKKPIEAENTAIFAKNIRLNYVFALLFGLIHGLGFSNYFLSIEADEAVMPLLAFNVGIEVGQLLIVSVILLASLLAFRAFKVLQKSWTLFISGAAFGIAATILLK